MEDDRSADANADDQVIVLDRVGGEKPFTAVMSIRQVWSDLEQRVDDGVKHAVHRLKQPLVKEIASLRSRVEKLQKSVEELRLRRANRKK